MTQTMDIMNKAAELTNNELNEITGGRDYYNKKYKVFVDPDRRYAYRMRLHGAEVRYIPVTFREEFLEGLE